jgi:hypothetical protein
MSKRNACIDQIVIRMYRMGTGDCFTIKFMKGDKVSFKMMIDCGCWTGSKDRLKPFLKELIKDVGEHVDVLVVTHEHKDHVLGFERGKELFTNGFRADRVWMAWTEEDGDKEVELWKKKYGEKKRALAFAAQKLSSVVASDDFKNQFAGAHEEAALNARKLNYAKVLQGFAELHATKQYADALAGMAVVKNDIAKDNITYLKPGNVIEGATGLEGVRIYVLGPPKLYESIKEESGAEGDAYEHNDQVEDAVAFASAVNALDDANTSQVLPFDDCYVSTDPNHQLAYNEHLWRKINHDWLFSAGSLALRMNSLTNNLSLVLAIEFVDSGKILLFPGDAEFGSWQSWHRIDWKKKELKTANMLNRVVFYKVAHHLSHNGTARRIGLEMMTSPDLTAMATLDYEVIADGWKSTMPNVGILKDLLEKTKGRTIIMNTEGLLFDRTDGTTVESKIEQYRKGMNDEESKVFKKSLEETELYVSFTLNV